MTETYKELKIEENMCVEIEKGTKRGGDEALTKPERGTGSKNRGRNTKENERLENWKTEINVRK